MAEADSRRADSNATRRPANFQRKKRRIGRGSDAKEGSEGVELGKITVGKSLKYSHNLEGNPLKAHREEFEQILSDHVKEGSVFAKVDAYGVSRSPALFIQEAMELRWSVPKHSCSMEKFISGMR